MYHSMYSVYIAVHIVHIVLVMDLKATLVSSNNEKYNGRKCSYLKCRTKYCILNCTTVGVKLAPPSSLGWSLPPSVHLAGA